MRSGQLSMYCIVLYCTSAAGKLTTRIKFNEWSELVTYPGSPDFKANALTPGPHCFPQFSDSTTYREIVSDKCYMELLGIVKRGSGNHRWI